MRIAYAGIFVTLLLLSGCSSHAPAPQQQKQQSTKPTLNKLYTQYEQWRGTPNRNGGLSKSGVDCSGLIYLTFKQQFGVTLPRDTRGQVKSGREIEMSQLKAGDLLFFKTGPKIRHVGIYLEKGRFMHSSSKIGVTISSVNDRYWKKHYWQSRRVLR